MLVELSVKHIVRDPLAARCAMVLHAPKDKEGRYIKICIGQTEGEAVENWLNDIIPPRPMTYDLICSIFSLFEGAKISKIIIDSCEKDIFYAKMIVSVAGKEQVIDCRPSDAVAVAVRLKAPIYAECCLLDKHGFCCSQEV